MRRHKITFALVGLLAGAVLAYLWHTPGVPTPTPQSYLPNQLARHAYQSGQSDFPVRVPFERTLTPTADPLVYEYRPGFPARLFPPVVVVRFLSPPGEQVPPVVVTGTASFRGDTNRRTNGVPGHVLISAASVVRPASR